MHVFGCQRLEIIGNTNLNPTCLRVQCGSLNPIYLLSRSLERERLRRLDLRLRLLATRLPDDEDDEEEEEDERRRCFLFLRLRPPSSLSDVPRPMLSDSQLAEQTNKRPSDGSTKTCVLLLFFKQNEHDDATATNISNKYINKFTRTMSITFLLIYCIPSHIHVHLLILLARIHIPS